MYKRQAVARVEAASPTAADEAAAPGARRRRRLTAGLAALAVAAVALLACFALGLGAVPSVIVVLLAFVTCAMSAQSVGQTGIDPMEIFGLIVLLAVAALSDVAQVQLFFVAGVVAVACGLAGDIMNDFKAGHVLGTDPRAQWIGQAVGGVLGAVVAVAVMAAVSYTHLDVYKRQPTPRSSNASSSRPALSRGSSSWAPRARGRPRPSCLRA